VTRENAKLPTDPSLSRTRLPKLKEGIGGLALVVTFECSGCVKIEGSNLSDPLFEALPSSSTDDGRGML